MKIAACKVHKLAEVYIKQKELIEINNTLFITKSLVQSNKIDNKIDIKDSKMNIVIKIFKTFKTIAVIYINLIIYNIMNLFTYIDKFKINFINLSLFKTLIVIKAPEAFKVFEADNVTSRFNH